MRVRRRALRKVLGVAGLVSALTWAVVVHGASTSAQDADLYAVQAFITPGPLALGVSSPSYTLSSGVCAPLVVPSPVSTTVPGYLDVPPDEKGNCTSVTGGGTLWVANCNNGFVTAAWTLKEPNGDSALFDGSGVMVGGVAVIVAAPAVSALGTTGYWDPMSTASPGSAVSVALFAPTGTSPCPDSSYIGQVTAAIVAAY